MKKQSWVKTLVIISALTLSSCATTNEEASVLTRTKEIAGLEAALEYENEMLYNDSVKLLYNAAYSYLEAEVYDKALSLADQGIEEYPEYLRFYYLKAYILKTTERNEEYKLLLESIIEKNPADIKVLELLLEVYANESLQEKEIETARKILSYNINNEKALASLAKYFDFYKIYEKKEAPPAEETAEATEEKPSEEDENQQEKEETPVVESPEEVNP